MSPRAACRLAALGFSEVYDYTAGKLDWLARGLPREGEKADERRAFELVVDDVVTCRLSDRVADVGERVATSRYRFAFVVTAGGVLLGRLRRAALEGDDTARAEDVMEPGPSTIRADSQLEPLAERMREGNLTSLPVTDPEGRLLGVVRRDDVEAELARQGDIDGDARQE
jgi:CBS domain-containing protein